MSPATTMFLRCESRVSMRTPYAEGCTTPMSGRPGKSRIRCFPCRKVLERHGSLVRTERCRLGCPRPPVARVHPGQRQPARARSLNDHAGASLALRVLSVPYGDEDVGV